MFLRKLAVRIISKKYENERINIISRLTSTKKSDLKSFLKESELLDVLNHIRNQYVKYTNHEISRRDYLYTRFSGSMLFPCTTLYALLRALKPKTVIETGGTPGKSSAAILSVLNKNGDGLLYTFDLPPEITTKKIDSTKAHESRPDLIEPYWAVPQYLRKKHKYVNGDTKKTLLKYLKKIKKIDIFIHDSFHSYEHMCFEFKTAWPFIRSGGLLMSDDVFCHNAFQDFAKSVGRKAYYIGNYGILKK